MEIKKIIWVILSGGQVMPHPGRDKSRGYAHPYAGLFCETTLCAYRCQAHTLHV